MLVAVLTSTQWWVMSASRTQSLVTAWQKGNVQPVHGWCNGAKFVQSTPSGERRASEAQGPRGHVTGEGGWSQRAACVQTCNAAHRLVMHPGLVWAPGPGRAPPIWVSLMICGGDYRRGGTVEDSQVWGVHYGGHSNASSACDSSKRLRTGKSPRVPSRNEIRWCGPPSGPPKR